MRIEACFDSHVHWAATGEFAQRLDLSELKSPEEIVHLAVDSHHWRGDWLLGFGWDESRWSSPPNREILDRWQKDKPVALTRSDAHALWLNSEALKRAGFLSVENQNIPGGRIDLDKNGVPTGVVVDKAADRVRKLISPPAAFDLRRHLLKGVKMFNEAGFTHIRDMTCDEAQWKEALRLDESGLLTLAVEEYFWLKDSADLSAQLDFLERAKASATPNLRVCGIKVFLDGALGSEGALISRCYHGQKHRGSKLWEDAELSEVLRRTWEKGFAVAVHVIGDEASDHLLNLVCNLKNEGLQGALHLEHAEILRSETIAKLKGLDVTCHLQPAHWLSDHSWLQSKIGELSELAFPWRRLQEAEVRFDFGSDSPIATANIKRTFQALRESAEAGVPRLLGSPASHMSHADLAWAANSYTLLEDDVPVQVVFRGEHLI